MILDPGTVFTILAVGFAVTVAVTWTVLGRYIRKHWRRWLKLAALYVVAGRWLRRSVQRSPVLQGDDIYQVCPLSFWQGDPNTCRWCNRALPDNEPRFCGPWCADPARDNHEFDRARSAARRRDNYRCRTCGRQERLQVNHRTPILGAHKIPGCHHHLEPGPDGRGGLETLCSGRGSCHQAETNRQRANGWAS